MKRGTHVRYSKKFREEAVKMVREVVCRLTRLHVVTLCQNLPLKIE